MAFIPGERLNGVHTVDFLIWCNPLNPRFRQSSAFPKRFYHWIVAMSGFALLYPTYEITLFSNNNVP
ncbi:MAG: hypothetical protein OXM61_02890 [Candidatus Poribacteria bacterium]|nr:hypothetical protein [Candidatus Poribacteria bacterium]